MVHVLGVISVLGYLAASLLYLLGLSKKGGRLWKLGLPVFRISFVVHTLLLGWFFLNGNPFDLESGGDYFLWISWIVALGVVGQGRRLDFPIMGALLSAATSLFLVSSSYMAHLPSAATLGVDTVLVVVHALPAVVAEVCLLFALLVSSMFLIQERRIKRKVALADGFRGPNLEALESLNHRFVLIGFVAMSLAVVTGSFWALEEGRQLLRGDFYQWVSLLAWLLLAFILHSRIQWRWSARKLSRLTLWVTGLFLLSIVVFVCITGNVAHGSMRG